MFVFWSCQAQMMARKHFLNEDLWRTRIFQVAKSQVWMRVAWRWVFLEIYPDGEASQCEWHNQTSSWDTEWRLRPLLLARFRGESRGAASFLQKQFLPDIISPRHPHQRSAVHLFRGMKFLSQSFNDQANHRIACCICKKSPKDANRKMEIKTCKHNRAS